MRQILANPAKIVSLSFSILGAPASENLFPKMKWGAVLSAPQFFCPFLQGVSQRERGEGHSSCLESSYTSLYSTMYNVQCTACCSSQPSRVHWLSSSIFPFCLFVCSSVRPAMVTSYQISTSTSLRPPNPYIF